MSVSARKVIAFALLAGGFALLIAVLAVTHENGTGQGRSKALDDYSQAPTPTQTVSTSPSATPTPIGNLKDKAVLRIPVLGKHWVQPIVAGVGQDVLDSGVLGRFPESVAPGAVGNYSLTGHRVTHGEPLRYLTMVEKGDTLYVDSGGIRYIYKVTRRFVVDFHDVSVLDSDSRKMITVITCDSYTQHTDDRFVVRGRLTGTEAL